MILSHIAHIAKKRQELERRQAEYDLNMASPGEVKPVIREVVGSPYGLCSYMRPPIPLEPEDFEEIIFGIIT